MRIIKVDNVTLRRNLLLKNGLSVGSGQSVSDSEVDRTIMDVKDGVSEIQRSVTLADAAESPDNSSSNAFKAGQRLRNLAVRLGAVATDDTGKSMEAIRQESKQASEQLVQDEKERSRFGEALIALGDAADTEMTRRDIVTSGQTIAEEASEGIVVNMFIPWPLRKLYRIFRSK